MEEPAEGMTSFSSWGVKQLEQWLFRIDVVGEQERKPTKKDISNVMQLFNETYGFPFKKMKLYVTDRTDKFFLDKDGNLYVEISFNYVNGKEQVRGFVRSEMSCSTKYNKETYCAKRWDVGEICLNDAKVDYKLCEKHIDEGFHAEWHDTALWRDLKEKKLKRHVKKSWQTLVKKKYDLPHLAVFHAVDLEQEDGSWALFRLFSHANHRRDLDLRPLDSVRDIS